MRLMSFTVVAETDINAPIETVWAVLTDMHRYADWSTWLRYEGGDVVLGQKISLRLTPPDGGGYSFHPEILVLEPPNHFAWIGRTGLPHVFDGEHHFELSSHQNGTHLINRERYSGLLSPLMKRLPMMKDAKPGFEAMNAEVKQRAESLAHSDG